MTENGVPRHIGFIMDGNGRWAEERGLPRSAGHVRGVHALKKLVLAALDYEIPFITVFAFSTENWSRPEEEVAALMKMITDFNKKEAKFLLERNIRVRFLGDIGALKPEVKASIAKIETLTGGCASLQFNIALNYSGKSDILQAVNKAVEKGEKLDYLQFENLLYTKDVPPPDLIVRTGGEKRLSNFMLYQAAYSELIFINKYWPDFNKKLLEKILAEYAGRVRRFGGLGESEV